MTLSALLAPLTLFMLTLIGLALRQACRWIEE